MLCGRLILNHPFLDGNKRVGLVAMLITATLNEFEMRRPVSPGTDTFISQLAAREIDEAGFCAWLRRFVGPVSG